MPGGCVSWHGAVAAWPRDFRALVGTPIVSVVVQRIRETLCECREALPQGFACLDERRQFAEAMGRSSCLSDNLHMLMQI